MKRSALTAAVEEIVERGKLKTEEGALFYPVMAEPAVMAFFGAPEALTEVILERPILLLNLIQTNKALQKFWEQTPDIWLILIDNLILNESNPLFLDTYPFFAIANRRARVVLDIVPDIVERRRKRYGDGDFMYKPMFAGSFNEVGKFLGHEQSETEPLSYQLVYYDDLTKIFIEMLQIISYLYEAGSETGRLVFVHPRRALAAYITTEIRDVDCLEDCFLIKKGKEDGSSPLKYSLSSMQTSVKEVKRIADLYKPGITRKEDARTEIVRDDGLFTSVVAAYPKTLLDLFLRLKVLANALVDVLTKHFNGTEVITQKEAVYIDLDKAIATPYRSMLYDKEQGIYNTPDKQRTLLLGLLRRTLRYSWLDDMIETYGQMVPLSCFVCHKETHMVDPLLKKAFCNQACYSLFSVVK